MSKLAKSLSRVLAIQNFGSSGTKLLHALLDNHPNILAIPSLYMISFYTFWPKDIEREREKVIEEFCQDHEYWFDPKGYVPWGTHTMGPNKDESVYVERDVFNSNLHKVLENKKNISRKAFFQALFVAYGVSYGRQLELTPDKYIMIYPYHTARNKTAVELTKDFPDTFFIHCFRELIQTMGSSYKVGSTRYRGFAKVGCTGARLVLTMFLQDRYLDSSDPYKMHGYSSILPEYKSRSKALRLEDLVKEPKETLTKLCEWIGIPWDDELLVASYNGKIWWNRPESARITGLSKIPLSQKHNDVFSQFDRYRLEVLLSKLHNEMGYVNESLELPAMNKSIYSAFFLIPFKMEILSSFPSKFSFPKTHELIKHFPQKVQTVFTNIVQNRSLYRSRIGELSLVPAKEIYNFSVNWMLLSPILSYIKVRRMLYQALAQLKETPEVVEKL